MNCKFPKQKSSQNFGPSNFKSIAGDEPYRWSPIRLELAEGSGNATLRHRGGNWKRTGGCLCLTRAFNDAFIKELKNFVCSWLRSIMTPSIVGTWDTSNWIYKTKKDKWTCSEMHAFQHRYHYDHDDNSSSWWGNWRSLKSWSFSSPRWKFSGFGVI